MAGWRDSAQRKKAPANAAGKPESEARKGNIFLYAWKIKSLRAKNTLRAES